MSARLAAVMTGEKLPRSPAQRLLHRVMAPLVSAPAAQVTPPVQPPLSDPAVFEHLRGLVQGPQPTRATLGCVLPPDLPPFRSLQVAGRALAGLLGFDERVSLALDISSLQGQGAHLLQLVAGADQAGVPLVFDSLSSQATPEGMDSVLAAVAALSDANLPLPTLTLAGRWRRSRADADWACARGLALRVVKGHRADPLQPQHDAVAGLRSLVARLAGRARFVTLATNDPALARDALTQLRRAGTPCELELMQGLPSAAAEQVARQLGVPVRVFVPWGAPRRQCTVSAHTRDPREVRWADTPSDFGALD